MPATLSDLQNNSKRAHITFSKDAQIYVVFYPHRINADMIDRFQAASDAKDYDEAAAIFSEVVTEWDLLGDDGEPLPFDGQTMRTVGSGIMNEIWSHLTDAITPKSPRKSGRS
jgi:hypothetical protein